MIRPRAAKKPSAAAMAASSSSPSSRHVDSPSSKRKPRRKNSSILIIIVCGAGLIVMGMIALLNRATSSSSSNSNSNSNNLRSLSSSSSTPPINININPTAAQTAIRSVRDQFAIRYGAHSDILLERGIETFGSLDVTAHRILEAARYQRPFVFSFSGYSVTVGRGNFFNQSFPFEMQRILKVPFQQVLGVDVVVRNGAIGGIPSFPYGFCLEHFLGTDPDVISWDYSMNEGGKDSSVLESFIRQALQQLPKRPMLIMLDQNEVRTKLVEQYTTTTTSTPLLLDAIAVGKKDILDTDIVNFDINDNNNNNNNNLPPGFQEWDEFGAPKQCPGRGSWHPKRQEHAMIGWMIAMHFINALERAVEIHNNNKNNNNNNKNNKDDIDASLRQLQQLQETPTIHFPKPYSTKLSTNNNNQEVMELLYGHKSEGIDGGGTTTQLFSMKDVSCRTSFLPATDHSKVLSSVVLSGLGPELDIMTDRTDDLYQQGWMLDVSKVERDTKRKVERCGGLGYLDMKIALYGIPESGTLKLWLPFEEEGSSSSSHAGHGHDDEKKDDGNSNWFSSLFGGGATAMHEAVASTSSSSSSKKYSHTDAKHWFDDLVLCEANEKRGDNACHLDHDLDIVVGGVSSSKIEPIKGAGEYLKRTTCVNVGIPETAQITKLGDLSVEEKKSNNYAGLSDTAVGLMVDITVKASSSVTRNNGACCLSHIVWEQH